ncbi:hypothetical protein [Streptosporangium longisporum]|uniref:Uncharacterized protein n=1 Tax=Streptosporangium longisporum TaxID=46187 RepID=A0ABP6KZB4_9ACTN
MSQPNGDIYGIERAPFELEVGAFEIDPASGEIPVVVINSRLPHSYALRAIKTWRERLILPAPLLAFIDLVKEYPLGAIMGATAAAATAATVAITAAPVTPSPADTRIISEHLTATGMTRNSQALPGSTPTIASTATRRVRPSRTAGPSRTARPSRSSAPTSRAERPSADASAPELSDSPAPSRPPRSTTPPPAPTDAARPEQTGPATKPPTQPSQRPSPAKPTLLPQIDVDVPLIDEDPIVDGVCGLLPIGCPIG